MRSLRLRSQLSAITANCLFTCLFISGFGLVDISVDRSVTIAHAQSVAQPISQPIAQSITQPIAQSVAIPALACPQVTNRRYVVITDRPANLLPQLPNFLAIAAVPCSYLNASMTFFGGFDNAKSSTFRASQLRELKLDAIVHSFVARVTDIPANLRAAIILVETGNDPNLAIQQVRSLTGKSAVLATFNNRSVILAAPLSSPQSANAIASLLRNQGLAAQVVSADLITPSPAIGSIPAPSIPTPSIPTQNPNSSARIYRVLVPNASASTLKQLRKLAPDSFVTIFKGKSYIQLRTYNNRVNAHRERDRLNVSFPGTILLQD